MNYQVVLPEFQGPLDLLLHLIDSHELDIYDIPIAFITGQYMEYLRKAEEIDLNLSGDFMVMAGTLLVIKARMLLPKRSSDDAREGEELDPRDELVEKLLAYRLYKENADELKKLEASRTKIHFRDVNERYLLSLFPQPNPVGDLRPADLHSVFQEMLRLMAARGQVITVHKEDVSINDKMEYLMAALSRHAGGMRFSQLLESCETVKEAITMFLAMLELIAKGRLKVRQDSLFGEIFISVQSDTKEGGDGV
jgi:segregation and condensation protein A